MRQLRGWSICHGHNIFGRYFSAIVSRDACMLQRDRLRPSQHRIGPAPRSNGRALIVIELVSRGPGTQHYESTRHPSPSYILALLPGERRGWAAPRRLERV